MLLRESSAARGTPAELELVTGGTPGDGNVPAGAALAELAAGVASWDAARTEAAVELLVPELGLQGVADAIGVASSFNGITRVADSIGIRLDETTATSTTEMRARTGIDAFAPAAKWAE